MTDQAQIFMQYSTHIQLYPVAELEIFNHINYVFLNNLSCKKGLKTLSINHFVIFHQIFFIEVPAIAEGLLFNNMAKFLLSGS